MFIIYQTTIIAKIISVSDIFDRHIKESIPAYNEFQQIILELSDYFCVDGSAVLDLGCSLGETVNNINIRHGDKLINITGIDNSESMVNKTIDRFKNNSNIHIRLCDCVDFFCY